MTTNNHPAHGPVSLDRLHQIREILSKAAAQSNGGNLGYAMADAVKVIEGVIEAVGAEPVAWVSDNYAQNKGLMFGEKEKGAGPTFIAKYWDLEMFDGNQDWLSDAIENTKAKPLYTAPPAPVVPDAIEPDYEVIKSILPTANPDEYACCIAADMWNSCRAAMLQAGNSPATTDGWIPVSERMPEQYVEVMVCTDAGSRYIAALNRQMNWDDGDFFDDIQNVTHWMPLPAAPRGERRDA